jgi:hypothetical protein
MISFSVTSIKKAISEFQEDSMQLTTQQKSNPLFSSERASEASKRPSVWRRFYIALHASVRTRRQHRPDTSQCSRRIRNPLQTRIEKTVCNHLDAKATSFRHGLNKETHDGRYEKAVAVYRPEALCLSLDAAL